jgi:hypothetical protein
MKSCVMTSLILLMASGCMPGAENDSESRLSTHADEPMTHRFSFAVVADPHIQGSEDHDARLESAVAWINAEASNRDIQLTLVLGDIGWGETGLERSLELLTPLSMPWVPVIGDNVVISGQDAEFESVFEDQIAVLEQELMSWEKSPSPVWDPNYEVQSSLQNFRFEHEGVLFVALDWNIRGIGGLAAEFADLHDFDGGSWPFLVESLDGAHARPEESILLLSHIPLMAGALDVEEVGQVNTLTSPLSSRIDAAYAGHMHVTYDLYNKPGGYEVLVTDATWDDENVIRIVDVYGDGQAYSYVQELVEIP